MFVNKNFRNKKNMIVISATELMKNKSKYFDLAKTESIVVKRKNNFFELVDRGNSVPDTVLNEDFLVGKSKSYIKRYLSIPEKYRCNPYNVSPSGDVYFADRRNIEAILEAEKELDKGEYVYLDEDKELQAIFGKYKK